MISMSELKCWETNEINKAHSRFINKKLERNVCPKREKLKNFRKNPSRMSYKKENKYVKRQTRKKRRSFLKQNIYNEAYYKGRERDFKTYGWLTW